MKNPQKRILGKLVALFLAITVCLAPAANALTADQLKILLKDYYLDGVSDAVLKESTIEGIIKTLNDPYTSYMTAAQYQAFMSSMTDQEVGGIGIAALAQKDGLLIQSVMEGSSAKELGLTAGDLIIEVDGKSAAGQSGETIILWLRGKVGTEVSIKVLHQDGSTSEYKAARQLIVLPAVTSELVDKRVGYVNCKTFGPQTVQHILDALTQNKEAKVWLVDLRSNLGGDVSVASQSLGAFLGKGSVVYLRDGKDQYVVYQSSQEAETNQPAIVLTSSYTASAAEIFSGVIRDKQQGLVIGEKTYGKGVAQVLLNENNYPDFFKDGDAVRITAFRYFTPSGSTADHVGIIPHLMVDAMSADEIAMLLTESEPSGTDKSNFLCIQMGNWDWYLDLKKATTNENKAFFTRLLEALPPNTVVKQGTTDGRYKTVAVSQLVETYGLTTYHSRAFNDVQGSIYQDKINTLATYAIVKGQAAGLYAPNTSMTRAELCALLVQALGLKESSKDSPFSDVAKNAWYADEVNAAKQAGLVEGIGDGKFNPQGTVTEQQMITIMARAGMKLNAALYETAKGYNPSQDTSSSGYSDWARKSVWLLSESQKDEMGKTVNLLFSSKNQIFPDGITTRAEAAAQLYNILSYIKILPVT